MQTSAKRDGLPTGSNAMSSSATSRPNGVPLELVGVLRVARVVRDADARRAAALRHGLLEGMPDLAAEHVGTQECLLERHAEEQRGELVAAKAADDPPFPRASRRDHLFR